MTRENMFSHRLANQGATAMSFDTHLNHLATVMAKACQRHGFPVTYAGSVGMSHRFHLKTAK